jgi:uncharacterized protein YjbJ (UPF0337 family)
MTDGTTDDVQGRVKEAAGDLTDDPQLKREGEADRASGGVKDKIDDVADRLKDGVDRLKHAVRRD